MKGCACFGSALLGTLLAASMAAAALPQLPASWSQPHAPYRVYGNTYYVGTQGLGAVLITSGNGHVLIDGTLPEGARIIADNIGALGFRVEDIALILNSHVHFDHAGGLAELQQRSGAEVLASAASAAVLKTGEVDSSDPQYGQLPPIAPVQRVGVLENGATVRRGSLALVAHLTPGHTPGGTTWTWQSCEADRCLDIVYADSLNPISAAGYLYTDARRSPNGVALLESSFATLAALPCDVLIAPHPEFFAMAEKLAAREAAPGTNPFVDPGACQRYVETARARLRARIAEETGIEPSRSSAQGTAP